MLPIYLAMIDTQEDKDKFEHLYKTYRKLLFYVANKILKDDYLAEDAVHNTFLKVLENLERINEADCHKTRSLLVTITRNYCINVYNHQKNHHMFPLDENICDEGNEFAAHAENTDGVINAVLKLPKLYRGPLTLKYVQGFSNKEIANMLDISEANVRKRLERAKKMVLEILEKEDAFNDDTFDRKGTEGCSNPGRSV